MLGFEGKAAIWCHANVLHTACLIDGHHLRYALQAKGKLIRRDKRYERSVITRDEVRDAWAVVCMCCSRLSARDSPTTAFLAVESGASSVVYERTHDVAGRVMILSVLSDW